MSNNLNLDDQCIFCKIIKGEIPSYKVFETDHSFAFLDISPLAEGHTLLIPKYHCERMDEVPDEYLSELLPQVKKVIAATGCKDYNVVQNNGKIAFQHVNHVHIHVIPKPSLEQGMIFKMEDYAHKVERPKEELLMTLEKMKAALAKL